MKENERKRKKMKEGWKKIKENERKWKKMKENCRLLVDLVSRFRVMQSRVGKAGLATAGLVAKQGWQSRVGKGGSGKQCQWGLQRPRLQSLGLATQGWQGWQSRVGKAGPSCAQGGGKQGRPASAARPRGENKTKKTKQIHNQKCSNQCFFFCFFCAPATARRFNSSAAVCGQTVLVFFCGRIVVLAFLVCSGFSVSELESFDQKCKQGFWTTALPYFSFFFFIVFLCFFFVENVLSFVFLCFFFVFLLLFLCFSIVCSLFFFVFLCFFLVPEIHGFTGWKVHGKFLGSWKKIKKMKENERKSRVHGFTGSQVHGFMGSRFHGFTGSRVHGFKGSRVHGFTGFTGSRVHGFTSSRV